MCKRDENAQINVALTNTPCEDLPTLDKAELSDMEIFVNRTWQLMHQVSREIAMDEPIAMNAQAEEPTFALIAPP